MHKWQQTVLLTLSGLTLILTLTLIFIGVTNQSTAKVLQAEQNEINRGQVSQQVGSNIVREMANLSVNNSRLKDLLTKHGFTVNQKPSAQP